MSNPTELALGWLKEMFKGLFLAISFTATLFLGAFFHKPLLQFVDVFVYPRASEIINIGYIPNGPPPPSNFNIPVVGGADDRNMPMWM